MIRWALTWALFLATLLAVFLLMGEMDALRHLEGRSLGAAAMLSIALLSADILLPIPSSVVMTFNGSLFRLFPGAMVSLVGLLIGAVAGYWLSRLFGKKIIHLIAGRHADERVRPFFDRFGLVAVVVSRPIPLIAEMVTCMAGTADMRFGSFLAGQIIGGIPLAFGYAWAGEFAVEQNSVFLGLLIAVAVPILLWALWSARGQV